MRRLIIPETGKLKIIEEKEPEVLPGTVKVKIFACGVCGSDLAQWQGHRDDRYFGHEFTGVVTEIGQGVNDLKVGDIVASGMIKSCGICWNCLNGHPNYCKNLDEVLFPGGFADYSLVTHSDSFKFLTKLPKNISFVEGTLHETISCVLRIVEFANLTVGQSVVIFGLGAIGAIAAEILKSLGAGKVIGLDLNPNRLESAAKLKIDTVVNRQSPDWQEQIRKEIGSHGADIVIEASGSPRALADAFEIARTGAHIVVGSVYHDSANNFNLSPIMRKELKIFGAKGSYPYNSSNQHSIAMHILTSQFISLEKIVKTYTLNNAEEAFTTSASGQFIKTVINFQDS